MAKCAKSILEAPEYSPAADKDAYGQITIHPRWWSRGKDKVAVRARAVRPGYLDIIRTADRGDTADADDALIAKVDALGLLDKVAAKVGAARKQVLTQKTPTVIFGGRLDKALPLLEPLKFTWVRGGSTPGSNAGLAAEQVAGLAALAEPGEKLYRVLTKRGTADMLNNTAAIYVLATPDEFNALLRRFDKYARQYVAKRFGEALVAQLLA